MEFWASAEVDRDAYPAADRARRYVGPFLNAAFESTSLAALDVKIRYVPIIMPESLKGHYPARSKLRKGERLIDCAPQLDFEVFVSGRLDDLLREYVRGIDLSAPYLPRLGADLNHIDEFLKIMTTAVEIILDEQIIGRAEE